VFLKPFCSQFAARLAVVEGALGLQGGTCIGCAIAFSNIA